VAAKSAPPRLDPAIPLTAAGAIFGALVGTTLLDVSNSAPFMRIVDHTTQALWIPVFLLFALLAAWPDSRRLRWSAWIVAGAVGLVTAGVVFFTTFGFTRDTDYVRLRLADPMPIALARMCGNSLETIHWSRSHAVAGRRFRRLRLPQTLRSMRDRRHSPERGARLPGTPPPRQVVPLGVVIA